MEDNKENLLEELLKVHEGTSWMYFVSQPRCEIKLYEALQKQNTICYLPLVKKETEYSHRIYTRMVPMFGGGYVFASINRNSFDYRGVSKYLRKTFTLMEHESIGLLKDLQTVRKFELLAKTHKVEVMTDLKVSDLVVITKGYFKGETAQIKRFKSHDNVTVVLTSLPVALMVELPVDFVNKE